MSILREQTRTRVPRFAEATVQRARLTVVPGRAPHATRGPFVTLLALLLVTGVAGLLLFNTSLQQTSFTTTALEQRATALEAEEQALELELELLRDPQRVAARAQRLGMVPASSPAFLRLSDGAVLGHPQPAGALEPLRITPLPEPKPERLDPDPIIVSPDKPRGERRSDTPGGSAASSADRDAADGRKNRAETTATTGE